jgi:hypothetical protein
VFEVPCNEQPTLMTAYRYVKQERFSTPTPFSRRYCSDYLARTRHRYSDKYFKYKE